jgi:cobalt/nickel transport system permease protein
MSSKKILVASLLAVFVGLQLGAFSVVLETLLSGRSELPFGTFVLLMQPIHLAIGVVEGFITAGVINFVKASRPELLESIAETKALSPEIKVKKIVLAFLVIAFITGGIVSWFASSNLDGLEWSIERVYGKPDLPEHETGIVALLRAVQERTAFLPDYTFKKKETSKEHETMDKEEVASAKGEGAPDSEANAWPNVQAGTSVSGILGSIMMFGLVFLIGFSIKAIRKKGAHAPNETSDLKG